MLSEYVMYKLVHIQHFQQLLELVILGSKVLTAFTCRLLKFI